VVAHGHLSPGGGFPGGVIIATGFFTALLTGDIFRIPEGLFSFFEGLAGLGFIGLGLLGLFGEASSFLAQTLPLGEFGALFSAGIIPFIYAVIGIKVAAELAGAVGRFYVTETGGAE
jgi:multicomponent Na+:H+ antiporter subunit B